MAFAPGGAGMTGLSAAVAELLEGVLMMTSVTRWIIGAFSLAAVCLAAGGAAALTAKGDDGPSAAKAVAAERGPRKLDVRRDDSPAPSAAQVLTLDDAIGLLLRGSVDLRQKFVEIPMARADVLAAPFRVRTLSGAAWPFLRPGGYSDFHPSGLITYDTNVAYPPDVSDERPARTRPVGAAKSVVEAQYQDAVRNRIDDLNTLYVDVQDAQERARWAEAAMARWDRVLLETNDRRAEMGDRAIAVEEIESSQHVVRLRRSEAHARLTHARRALYLTLDRSVPEADRLEVDRLDFTEASIPKVDDLIRLALDDRPDLSALRLGVARAEADIEKAGKQGGGIHRARINHQQAQTQLASLERAIVREVTERREACDSSRERFRAALLNLNNHRRAFLVAEQRYRTGEGNGEDLVRARNEYATSEAEYLDKLVRHRRSVLAMNTALGLRLFP
jgi:cobalt-zinc-cadmium efflux system outer membrane protein